MSITSLTVRDAITGEPVSVWPHEAHPELGGGHHVLLGTGDGGDLWLTPTGARQLAAQLLNAADTVTERQ